MKEIIIFWGLQVLGEDPIPYKEKRQTYLDFLDLLSKEAVVYICRGFENYLGNIHIQ